MHYFYSDNTATACPEILEAIAQANQSSVLAFGDDPWTKRLDAMFSEFFGAPVRAFVVPSGTAANALSLATLVPPYGAVFAHEQAHIVRDECGAAEFFSGGARVTPVASPGGKLTVDALKAAIDNNPPSVHTLQPAAISLTQATELGTAYRPDEIAALAELAHRRGMKIHMDGARLANAMTFLGCHPSEVTWRAGVDVLSFGATKNGALSAEAVVFFDSALVKDFELRRKRSGHLVSKARFVAAQLLAYVETGVWQSNAERANAFARQIEQAAAPFVLYPVEANEVFLRLGDEYKQQLREAGFEFYDWGPEASGEARLVVSWDQPEESVAALCEALQALQEPVVAAPELPPALALAAAAPIAVAAAIADADPVVTDPFVAAEPVAADDYFVAAPDTVAAPEASTDTDTAVASDTANTSSADTDTIVVTSDAATTSGSETDTTAAAATAAPAPAPPPPEETDEFVEFEFTQM